SLREEVEELGLEAVRVLELVDHDRAEPLARALADLLVAAKEVARPELEIFEVERRLPCLRLLVLGGELGEELLEERAIARGELLERGGDGGLPRLDERRRPRPPSLQLRQGQQPFRQRRRGEEVERALGGAALELGRPCIVDEAQRGLAQLRDALVECRTGPWLEHEIPARRPKRGVDPDEHLPQAPRAVRRKQAPATGLVRRAEALERGGERLGLYDERLRLVEHPERRVDRCGEWMGSEQAPAEAVDRRHPRPVELEREVRPPTLEQAFADPRAQLTGRA